MAILIFGPVVLWPVFCPKNADFQKLLSNSFVYLFGIFCEDIPIPHVFAIF